jgi:hypothetical protein
MSALMTLLFQTILCGIFDRLSLQPKPPNKAPEPTPTAVTPRASSRMMKVKQSKVARHVARGAPAAVVAHL